MPDADGAHLAVPRPDDPLLSGWHAVNCLREWRGDTHWALVVAAGLTHAEASILHNAWLGYETDWLAHSRGNTPEEISAGWALLERKGLVVDGRVTDEGIARRQQLEDDTDTRTTLPWELLGEDAAGSFAERFEPPCELLLARVDETAAPTTSPRPGSDSERASALAVGAPTSPTAFSPRLGKIRVGRRRRDSRDVSSGSSAGRGRTWVMMSPWTSSTTPRSPGTS